MGLDNLIPVMKLLELWKLEEWVMKCRGSGEVDDRSSDGDEASTSLQNQTGAVEGRERKAEVPPAHHVYGIIDRDRLVMGATSFSRLSGERPGCR